MGKFKYKILNDTVPVAVSGVMMVGLPCSGKSKIINEAMKKKVKLKIDNSDEHVTNHMLRTQEDKGLTMYELCVLGDKQLNQYAWSFTSGRSGITYAIMSCIIREMKNNLLGVDKVGFEKSGDRLQFDEKDLNAHLQWIFAKAGTQFEKIEVEREKIELLSCGLSLVNVFDVGVNKAVYDFLPYLAHSCRHLTRLVAFSVERDAHTLFNPPILDVEKYQDRHDASLVMRWRESMNYLLHFASLGHYSVTTENRGMPYTSTSNTSGKTVFLGTYKEGVHLAQTEQEFSDDFKRAKKEILKQTKSKNMCWITEEKYWLEIKDTKNLEHAEFIRRLISKSAEFQTQMPLEWLFLRSMVATACATDSREDKILTIEKKNLFRYAKALNMDENDFEEFITFFSSYGSIVPVECSEKKNDYIIVNVFEFTKKLSKIYYPEERNANYTQHHSEKYGIVEHKDLQNEVLRDYPGNLDHFIEIVIQFGMVAKVENVVNDDKKEISGSYYYIPSARIQQPRAKREAKTDSAYIVIESVNFPANVQASLAHSISNIESIKMHMVFTECSNVTTFQFSIGQSASKAQLELVYRGKETELRIINFDDLTDDIKEDLESHLKDVLLACCKSLNDESQQFRPLLYNIGFQCKKKHEIHYYYSDNNSDSDMCDCTKQTHSQSQIAVWKHAILRKGKIMQHNDLI